MMIFPATFLLLATISLSACSAQERRLAYDGWSLLAALPASNSETGVAALDGKVYVIGGQTTQSSEPAKAGFVNTTYESCK